MDIVKEGQTVLTRDLDLENGQAELSLTATPEMAGTVDFNAYLFGRDARPVGDHRLIFVQPADELKIETVADAPVYKPGAEARDPLSRDQLARPGRPAPRSACRWWTRPCSRWRRSSRVLPRSSSISSRK